MTKILRNSAREQAVQADADSNTYTEDESSDSDDDSIELVGDDDDEPVSEFVETEMDLFAEMKQTKKFKTLSNDFGNDVALAALISCKTDDMDELTDWCFEEHPENEVEAILNTYRAGLRAEKSTSVKASDRQQSKKTEPVLLSSKPEVSSISSRSDDWVSEQFQPIWKEFIEELSSQEVSEHLHFQTLARCLEDLFKEAQKAGNLQRTFFSQF